MRADRLLAIVLLLQNRGRQTAGRLAAELGVSVRTIYRDIGALSTAGIPVYSDSAGYQLVDGYRTELTGLTAAEARGLVLAGLPGAAADLGMTEAVASVQLKLAAALPEALRLRAERMRERFYLDAPGWYHDGDASEHLAKVVDAVWRQNVIEATYESWTRTGHHAIEPYGIVLKAGKWYLVGRSAGRVRTFRVGKIQHLAVLPDRFDWPDEFNLASFWRQHITEFRDRLHQGHALVRLSPTGLERLPHLMGDTVAAAARAGETQPDGWIVARVPIESERHAQQEFLRLGVDIEVLEPASLREQLAATAARLASIYSAPG